MTGPQLPANLANALSGAYELLQEIGRGGMGVVYAARDIRLDRLVAIKVLPEIVSSDAVRDRFLREARAAARLSHPSIVPIYAADERDGVTFLVMAYVDGPTLASRLSEGARLSFQDAIPILCDVAHALSAASARGVIHRDIKPENILIDRESGRAMVTDFGIARFADAMHPGALTRTGQVLGTVGYMSPEQVTAGEVDGRSDLYSLGVVAFEMLAGRLPFDGPAPSVIVAHATKPAPSLMSVTSGVPLQLCEIVDRCLRKDPADRFASGDELAAALALVLGTPDSAERSRIAHAGDERVISEKDAERIWQRAAELQAGIGSSTPPRAPTASMTAVPRSLSNGFKLEHVREAARDVGISAAYVTLALDEVLHGAVRVATAQLPALAREGSDGPATIQERNSTASALAGAPMSIIYEVDLEGQLSPDDFEVVAHRISSDLGEEGLATALGRTLSWSSPGRQHQRRLHVNITAAGGHTHIRVEEKLSNYAGALFGSVMGAGGLTLGTSVLGAVMATTHMAPVGFSALGAVFLTSYVVARSIFTRTVTRRDHQLEKLINDLGAQVTSLIDSGKSRGLVREQSR